MFGAKVYLLVVFLCVETHHLQGAEVVAPLNVANPLHPERDAKDNPLPTRNPAPEYYRERFLKRPSAPDRFDNSASGSFISSPGANRYPPLQPDYNRDRIGGSAATGSGYGYGYGGNFLGGSGGSFYDSVRGPYGPPQMMDYPGFGTGFDGAMDYGHSGYGFLGQPPSHHYSAKSLFLPLAGAALLGVAAALVANPVLLQLGVISGKRRKRSVSDDDFAHKLAYKKQTRR